MKKLVVMMLVFAFLTIAAMAQAQFAQSDTFSVTNSGAVITVTNYPESSLNIPWYPGGVMLRAFDSPTGDVLVVQYVRSGVTNRLIATNSTFSITNTVYASNTAVAVTTLLWVPGSDWPLVPGTDSMRLTTSSTNAVVILNRKAAR